jgi:uncharacterized membrane protein YidH (DUF202 family)
MTTTDPDPDPGLARQRTALAWSRTAIAFAALGGVVLKRDVAEGLIIMAAAPAVWRLGQLKHHLRGRLELVTITIVLVSAIALVLAF